MSMQPCGLRVTVDFADRHDDATLFKALADPYRRTILATPARAGDEVCVCDFTSALPLAGDAADRIDGALRFLTPRIPAR